MKTRRFYALLAAAFAAASSPAFSEGLAMPGSHWAVLQNSPEVGPSGAITRNTLLSGRFEQGIDLARAGSWKFNTFLSVGYSADHLGYIYNNKVTPALGLKWYTSSEGSTLEFGITVGDDYRWKLDNQRHRPGVTAYVSTWQGWNLSK